MLQFRDFTLFIIRFGIRSYSQTVWLNFTFYLCNVSAAEKNDQVGPTSRRKIQTYFRLRFASYYLVFYANLLKT